MPPFHARFIPNNSTSVYRVHVNGRPRTFKPPAERSRPQMEGEVVHPFLDRSGGYTITVYPISPEHCNYHMALWRGEVTLEAQATRVHCTIFTFHDDRNFLVALFMVAWYLADDDASIMQLPVDFDFVKVDVAVWAVVAFVRNMWAFKSRLSADAFRKYMDCYYQFVTLLNLQGVRLYTQKHPVE